MKKQLLLLLVMILLPMVASADAVEINGIYYNLIEKAKVAEVTSNPNKYSGSITIPQSISYDNNIYNVTRIKESAFYECFNLTSVIVPNSVTSIGSNAFGVCSALTSITIPNSVTSIGDAAFAYCINLVTVTIPNSVTKIEERTFRSCSALTSITIPNSVTSIGNAVFADCTGLTSLTIGNNVTSIGKSTFYGCSHITDIIIPNSVNSIDMNAFSGCSGLKSVTIGTGIKTISTYAFTSCPNLADVYCHAESVPNTASDAFKDSYIEYATLHVPVSAVDAYKAADSWKNFKSIVALTDQETSITGIHQDNNKETSFFTLDGKQIESPRKGVNIVRTSNGKTKKVVIK